VHNKNQQNTKGNPNHDPKPNPTTKQQAIVNIQLNAVADPTYYIEKTAYSLSNVV